VVHIAGGADERYAVLRFRTRDPAGKQHAGISAAPHPFLPANTWFDVRLTLGQNATVTLEYKHVEMSDWIAVGALPVHDSFRPNYVAISAMRRGRVDDVGYSVAVKRASPFSPHDR